MSAKILCMPNIEQDWAWAAGVFEGEGTIGLTRYRVKQANYVYLRLEMQMTDADVMQRFAEIVGGKVYGPYQPKIERYKPKYHWTIEFSSPVRILDQFWPWLGERRKTKALECGYVPADVRVGEHTGRYLPASA